MADRILALAADMLDALSEEWSNNGCNDWDAPDDMGDEDLARLARHAWENNGKQADEDPSEPVLADFVAAGAVGHYLRHEVSAALADLTRLRALLAAYGRAVEERDEDVAADALRDIEEEARAQHAAGTGG